MCFIKKYISDSELAQDPLLVMTHGRATNMSLVPESKILIFIGCEYTLGLGSLESFYLTISNLDTSRFGYFPYFPMLSFFYSHLKFSFSVVDFNASSGKTTTIHHWWHRNGKIWHMLLYSVTERSTGRVLII